MGSNVVKEMVKKMQLKVEMCINKYLLITALVGENEKLVSIFKD